MNQENSGRDSMPPGCSEAPAPTEFAEWADFPEGDFQPDPEPPQTWSGEPARRSLWRDLFNSGIASESGDPLRPGRVREVNAALLLMLASAVVLAIIGAVFKVPGIATGGAIAGLLAGGILAAHRFTGRTEMCGHLTVALLFLAALSINVPGGALSGVSFGWFVMVPLLAGLLLSVRVAWLWTAVVATAGTVLWAFPMSGGEPARRIPTHLDPVLDLLNRLAIFLAVGLLVTLSLKGKRKSEDQIRDLALNDPLTGLQNRKSFGGSLADALDAASRDETRLALLFIDLDRFKEYNDTLGHAAGDAILRWVADVLQQRIRSSDLVGKPGDGGASISRLGGDEFTVVLSDIGSKQRAAQAAQRLLDTLSAPVTIGGVELFVSASIGVSVFPEDGRDADTLLRRADASMYSAKQRGGNSFEFFAPWMNEVSLRRIFIENRLRRATERNEISVLYQPLFDTRNGRVIGAEALARWNSPSMGDVAPGEFIQVAEDNAPLIVSVGDYVMREALGQLRLWHELGLPGIRMSVNFAVAQLRQHRCEEKIDDCLRELGLDCHYLELEITERIALAEDEPAMEVMRRLRRRGISIALDDFGTGKASISYLRGLPLNRIKIDRSFVSAVSSDPQEANLTGAIVAMAKSLGLSVTAEGVESSQQMEYLVTIGCDELQGFYLSRPLGAQDFEELLRGDQERYGALEQPMISTA